MNLDGCKMEKVDCKFDEDSCRCVSDTFIMQEVCGKQDFEGMNLISEGKVLKSVKNLTC